jgi:hypothetical protein
LSFLLVFLEQARRAEQFWCVNGTKILNSKREINIEVLLVAHYKNLKPRDKKKSVDEIDSSRFWDVPFLGGGALPPKIPTLSLVPQSNIISTLNKLFTPNKENIIYILIIYGVQ